MTSMRRLINLIEDYHTDRLTKEKTEGGPLRTAANNRGWYHKDPYAARGASSQLVHPDHPGQTITTHHDPKYGKSQWVHRDDKAPTSQHIARGTTPEELTSHLDSFHTEHY